jgi:hypothetical protein
MLSVMVDTSTAATLPLHPTYAAHAVLGLVGLAAFLPSPRDRRALLAKVHNFQNRKCNNEDSPSAFETPAGMPIFRT